MGDLIWIGNTLIPRGVVLAVGCMIAGLLIVAFVILTDKK